MAQLIGV